MIASSFATLPAFALYFALSIVLFVTYTCVYLWFTPYDEIAQVRSGDIGAAASFAGALIGYALGYGSAAIHSVSVADMVVWAIIAGAIQLITYIVASRIFFPQIHTGKSIPNSAVGSALGAISIVIGIINASCLTY